MEHELIEIDTRLALRDSDHTLVVLDRREPLHLELVDVVHEDAALLRLGKQLAYRTGARASLVGDVKALDDAARADRLKDGVRSGDRLARVVRWCCGRPRARGR